MPILGICFTATDVSICSIKGTVGEIEQCLSSCIDNITEIKATMEKLAATITRLEDKCENLESESRRNNVRIIGVPEGPDTSSTATVASLLKEAFYLESEPLIDRSHRTLQPKPKVGERPRAIVCSLHDHSDCVSILRHARELQQIAIQGATISVFPDHTAKITRARATFYDIRGQLRNIEGVRYGILHPARLRITYNSIQKDFVSSEEAQAYVRTITLA